MVVFLVAIPLSLGIGIVSGVSAESALIAAIVGGIVVGLLSGSPLMVSGPAAGLTVLVYQAVQDHGILALAAIIVFCGLFQIILGAFKLGSLFAKVPKSILHGMLSAIGFIILVGQLHVLAGERISGKPFEVMLKLWPTFEDAITHATYIVEPVLALGLLAIAILVFWPRLVPKLSWIPGALPAVVIATLLSFNLEMDRLSISDLIPTAKESFSHFFSFEWMDKGWVLLATGLAFALVASAESLLTARAADILVRDRDGESNRADSDLNREMMAQGMGNTVSGVLGGLPVTGVIARTSANINSGAKTRWSTVMHGSFILFFALAWPELLGHIPLTALAAILVVTGFRLLNVRGLVKTFKAGFADGLTWLVTFGAIVSIDLLNGLLIGLGFALAVHLFVRNPIETKKKMKRQLKKVSDGD